MMRSHKRRPYAPLFLALSLICAILVAASPGHAKKPQLKGLKTHPIKVSARRITRFGPAGKPGQKIGGLIWLGGLTLSSPSNYFGGFSGLAISPDGSRIFAASDAGFWFTANIGYRDGSPASLTGARVGPFRALSGRLLDGTKETDAEAVSLEKGSLRNGELLISFERIHRIGRFSVRNGEISKPSLYLKLPAYIKSLKSNRGLEALETLKGTNRGKIIMFAEGRRDARGYLRGWLLRKTRSSEIFLKPMKGFDVTGIAAHADGGILILERRFRLSEGVKMRIRRVHPRDIRPGKVITGETLIEVDASANIDNMEGITTHRTPDGQTVITLISDNNFNFFQRNLLLQFAIAENSAASQ